MSLNHDKVIVLPCIPNSLFDIRKFQWSTTTLRGKEKFLIPHLKHICINNTTYKCRIKNRGRRAHVYSVLHKQCIVKVRKSFHFTITSLDKYKCTIYDGEYIKTKLVHDLPYILKPIYSSILLYIDNNNKNAYEINIYEQWDGDMFDLCLTIIKRSLLQCTSHEETTAPNTPNTPNVQTVQKSSVEDNEKKVFVIEYNIYS